MFDLFETLGNFLAPSQEVTAPIGGLIEQRVDAVDYLVNNVEKIVENLPQVTDQIGRRISGIAINSDVLASSVELDAQALEIHDRAKSMRELRDAETVNAMAVSGVQEGFLLHEDPEAEIARINAGIEMMTTENHDDKLQIAIENKEQELRVSQQKIAEINATLQALYEAQNGTYSNEFNPAKAPDNSFDVSNEQIALAA